MPKLAIGQRWKNRDGTITTIIEKHTDYSEFCAYVGTVDNTDLYFIYMDHLTQDKIKYVYSEDDPHKRDLIELLSTSGITTNNIQENYPKG